jgi:hypothetical protein
MRQSSERSNRGYPKKKKLLNKIKPRGHQMKEKRNLLKLIPKLRKIKGN